jgi:hypothetical protein
MSWIGRARWGMARRGKVGQGKVRQGKVFNFLLGVAMNEYSNSERHTARSNPAKSGFERFDGNNVRPVRRGQLDEVVLGSKDLSQAGIKHPLFASDQHQFVLVSAQHEQRSQETTRQAEVQGHRKLVLVVRSGV